MKRLVNKRHLSALVDDRSLEQASGGFFRFKEYGVNHSDKAVSISLWVRALNLEENYTWVSKTDIGMNDAAQKQFYPVQRVNDSQKNAISYAALIHQVHPCTPMGEVERHIMSKIEGGGKVV